MMQLDTSSYNPKFTRGEKCIFFHLVLVFLATLVLLLIFIIHLYTVGHSKYTSVSTRRVGSSIGTVKNANFPQIGSVYIDTIMVCNSLLLNSKWSLGPANCIIARSHPDMAYLLMSWKISYNSRNNFKTKIKRNIAHTNFDRDIFTNNIGLLEHVDDIPLEPYVLGAHKYVVSTTALWNNKETKDLQLISSYRSSDGEDKVQVHFASLLPQEKCVQSISPIIPLRNYEFCVVPQENIILLEYGALVLCNSKIIGFYSWGEHMIKQLPFIFLNITYFQDWIDTMVYLD